MGQGPYSPTLNDSLQHISPDCLSSCDLVQGRVLAKICGSQDIPTPRTCASECPMSTVFYMAEGSHPRGNLDGLLLRSLLSTPRSRVIIIYSVRDSTSYQHPKSSQAPARHPEGFLSSDVNLVRGSTSDDDKMAGKRRRSRVV